jgi:hypothetical protein
MEITNLLRRTQQLTKLDRDIIEENNFTKKTFLNLLRFFAFSHFSQLKVFLRNNKNQDGVGDYFAIGHTACCLKLYF